MSLDAKELAKQGYRRTSNRHGMLARVDRPDWKAYMALRHSPWDPEGEGRRWVEALGNGAADHYRRVYSGDVITVPRKIAGKVPSSCWDAVGFVELREAA